MTRSRADLVAIAFLVALVTLFFAKELFTDATLVTFRLTNVFPWLADATPDEISRPSVTSDCALSYYPRRAFATEMIRQGKIPFWNPHQFCGTPFFANFQSAVLYPVNLAIYWLDPATQMDVFLYVHFLIAAVFGYLLGRKLKFSREASLITSLAFTFCGFMVTRFGQPTLVSTASWLPAVVYFAEHLVESPTWRRAGLLALALSLCILAGFPQLVLFVLYSVFVYVLLRLLLARGIPRRRKAVTLLFLTASAVTACFVCAFQLLPTYELSTFSYRKVLPYNMILSSAHHPLVALKYFIPDILGDPLDISVISRGLVTVAEGPRFAQNYVSTTGYVGVLPLLLGILALARPSRRHVPFVALSGLALLAVFGTPLLYLFYRVLPGFNFSRIDRLDVVFMFGFSVLAGYGFDAARSERSRGRLLSCGAGLMVFAALLVLWLRNSGLDLILRETAAAIRPSDFLAYASGKMLWFLVLAAASGTLLVLASLKWLAGRAIFVAAVVILVADLLTNGAKFKVSQPSAEILPANPMVDALVRDRGEWRIAKYKNDVLPANLATLVGIDDVHGYDALNVRHYLEVLGALDSSLVDVSNAALRRRIGPITSETALGSPILDLLNAKYVLSTVPTDPGRRQVGSVAKGPRTAVTLINEDFLPRAFLVPEAHYFPTYDAVLAYMKAGGFDPRREVLLVGQGPPGSLRANLEPGRADIVKYDETGLAVEVTARTRCFLVVSDVFYPGWRASVDDAGVALLRADYAFRAVALEPGTHKVSMTYKPPMFTIGVLFLAAGAALVAVMISSRRGACPENGGAN